MAAISSNGIEINVGDKVQIRTGGMDVTNGIKSKAGFMYGDGGPLMAEVVLIDNNWYTGKNFGLDERVVKVRCKADNGVIVWQVQPEDIIVKVSSAKPVQTAPSKPEPTPASPSVPTTPGSSSYGGGAIKGDTTSVTSTYPYATLHGSEDWMYGNASVPDGQEERHEKIDIETKEINNAYGLEKARSLSSKHRGVGWRKPTRDEQAVLGTGSLLIDDDALEPATDFPNMIEDPDKRRVLLANNIEDIQNQYGFPNVITSGKIYSSDIVTAKYDYQIVPGKSPLSGYKLEDRLQQARAAFGIPVHGSNSIARSMKYYMYNRFKVPDTNLAHSKSYTYVFFTRPDLNLLDCSGSGTLKPVDQVFNHTEGAMVWRRNPDILKLLTDSDRCDDDNNFNLLLSNQVRSFDISDEKLATIEAGNSWKKNTIVYGDTYSGREAGEFSCTFDETQDYSVYSLIKLWITYIDNVSKGAWRPSYNLPGSGVNLDDINASHVYTKTLDYAATVFVIKCGPGEEVLYWTQYFGVIPINTGAGAFSWEHTNSIGETPHLNITFRYSCKKDLSPVSLLVFNHNSKVEGSQILYEDAWNGEYGHTSRPFVGAPFIEITLGEPTTKPNQSDGAKRTMIRLRFKSKTGMEDLGDKDMFRSPY